MQFYAWFETMFKIALIHEIDINFCLHNFFVKPYTQRAPKGLVGNRRLYEHGIHIRHFQESNPQPVQSQMRGRSN